MLKRTKQAISSKKGESYIYVCVLVLFISMLVSVVIMYMGLMTQIQLQKKDVEYKLDSYVAETAVTMFDSIKQGDNYALSFDWNAFEQGAFKSLGFTSSSMNEYRYPNIECSMTRPTIRSLSGNGFGLVVQYTAKYPIVWNGKTYATLQIPITVTSYYKFK